MSIIIVWFTLDLECFLKAASQSRKFKSFSDEKRNLCLFTIVYSKRKEINVLKLVRSQRPLALASSVVVADVVCCGVRL